MSYNYYHPDWEYEEGKELSDMADVARGCLHMILTMIAFIVLLCLVLSMVSCTTTKYVEVPVTHTDTLIQTKVQRDSIWKHDSIYLHEWMKGDTVYIEKTRWLTGYKERLRIDTVYRSRIDTIYRNIEIPQEKDATSLTWWQQTKMHIGGVVFWLALLAFFLWLGKNKLKL
jgi:hypothetical protein